MSVLAQDLRVLVMAGGTGGHVFPALAVAQRLREQGAHVQWLGSRGGMEQSLVPKYGFEFNEIAIRGLRGNGLIGWLQAPWRIFSATRAAARVLRKMRANVVLGMGGFASGPGGLAAWLTRRPLIIHEQNAIAGLTNRILARFSVRVLEAFPGSFTASMNALHTGNPVRDAIAELSQDRARDAKTDNSDDTCLHLLVLGGSQGAQALNEVVPQALMQVRDELNIEVRHQAGARNLQSVEHIYQELGLAVQPLAFIDDMAASYRWADLVVCRAGAMTVAELAAAGVAAILVPYPHAVDDHQTANARYLSDTHAAVLLPQVQLSVASLTELLINLGSKPQRLQAMADAARALAITDADQRVAQHCMEVARA